MHTEYGKNNASIALGQVVLCPREISSLILIIHMPDIMLTSKEKLDGQHYFYLTRISVYMLSQSPVKVMLHGAIFNNHF